MITGKIISKPSWSTYVQLKPLGIPVSLLAGFLSHRIHCCYTSPGILLSDTQTVGDSVYHFSTCLNPAILWQICYFTCFFSFSCLRLRSWHAHSRSCAISHVTTRTMARPRQKTLRRGHVKCSMSLNWTNGVNLFIIFSDSDTIQKDSENFPTTKVVIVCVGAIVVLAIIVGLVVMMRFSKSARGPAVKNVTADLSQVNAAFDDTEVKTLSVKSI